MREKDTGPTVVTGSLILVNCSSILIGVSHRKMVEDTSSDMTLCFKKLDSFEKSDAKRRSGELGEKTGSKGKGTPVGLLPPAGLIRGRAIVLKKRSSPVFGHRS